MNHEYDTRQGLREFDIPFNHVLDVAYRISRDEFQNLSLTEREEWISLLDTQTNNSQFMERHPKNKGILHAQHTNFLKWHKELK